VPAQNPTVAEAVIVLDDRPWPGDCVVDHRCSGMQPIRVDLSSLDLLVMKIDDIHMDEDLTLVAAISVDAKRAVPMPPQPR
jgi:hypothetical protein